MPLSAPADRALLHTREIVLRGYRRRDGLYDIEASLADTKTHGFDNHDRGHIAPGDKLHGMFARMTLDEAMTVRAFEAAMDHTPYAVCPQVAGNFSRLAGLVVGRGFLRAAMQRVGGTEGCTHLRELLQQMATVAFQTLYAVRHTQYREAGTEDPPRPPALLDTCHAWSASSPMIAREFPAFHRAPAIAEADVP